jgi:hypothetical protein
MKFFPGHGFIDEKLYICNDCPPGAGMQGPTQLRDVKPSPTTQVEGYQKKVVFSGSLFL